MKGSALLLLGVLACGSSPATVSVPDGEAITVDAPAPALDAAVAPDLPAVEKDAAVLAPDAALDVGMTSAPDAAACGTCTSYAAAELVGQVQDPQLDAVSGIAASWRNPGVLYVHNDCDWPEFFAVAESGAVLGHFTISGSPVRDVEDIAVGRCPAGTCVHLADLATTSRREPSS